MTQYVRTTSSCAVLPTAFTHLITTPKTAKWMHPDPSRVITVNRAKLYGAAFWSAASSEIVVN